MGGGMTPAVSAAGASYWPLATCPFLEPPPSLGGGAHRPLIPSCPPAPCLAYPCPHTPFLSPGMLCQQRPPPPGGGGSWGLKQLRQVFLSNLLPEVCCCQHLCQCYGTIDTRVTIIVTAL